MVVVGLPPQFFSLDIAFIQTCKETRFAILTLAPHFIDTDGPICHPHRLSK
jgi:hypothetical protein